MRQAFFNSLYRLARQDRRIILLIGDLGAIYLDRFRADLPRQCINVGIAEQNMIGIAAGLAMSGKIVYVHSQIPFLTMRGFEQIRIDLSCQNLPVKLIGIGAGLDYSTLGPTHHGLEDISLMRSLPGMTILSPADDISAAAFAGLSYKEKNPTYIRLDRSGEPLIYKSRPQRFTQGMKVLRNGKDLFIIATGRMVYLAQQLSEILAEKSIKAGVIDLYRIKPLNSSLLVKALAKVRKVVTIEEHSSIGGIGTLIAEELLKRQGIFKFKKYSLPDKFCRRYGSRRYLHGLMGLSAASIRKDIVNWLSK